MLQKHLHLPVREGGCYSAWYILRWISLDTGIVEADSINSSKRNYMSLISAGLLAGTTGSRQDCTPLSNPNKIVVLGSSMTVNFRSMELRDTTPRTASWARQWGIPYHKCHWVSTGWACCFYITCFTVVWVVNLFFIILLNSPYLNTEGFLSCS